MGNSLRIVVPTVLALAVSGAIVTSELWPSAASAEAAGTEMTALAVAVEPEGPATAPVPTCEQPGDRISAVEVLARMAEAGQGSGSGDWVVLNNRGYNYERGTSLIEPEALDFEARSRR